MYVRNRLPAPEIPEGTTYYAIKPHIRSIYTNAEGHVLTEIDPRSLLDPEPWEGWFIPIQRTGDTFRILYREMNEPERILMGLP